MRHSKCKSNINILILILTSDKFKHSDTVFKYFIGYKNDNFIRPFMIEDDSVSVKYRDIWNRIKDIRGIKFHSNPIYDKKYVKAKIKIFNSVINTNFGGHGVPKEGVHYTCIACTHIGSVRKIDKKIYPQIYLEEFKYKIKKRNMVRFIDVEVKSDSGSDSE